MASTGFPRYSRGLGSKNIWMWIAKPRIANPGLLHKTGVRFPINLMWIVKTSNSQTSNSEGHLYNVFRVIKTPNLRSLHAKKLKGICNTAFHFISWYNWTLGFPGKKDILYGSIHNCNSTKTKLALLILLTISALVLPSFPSP